MEDTNTTPFETEVQQALNVEPDQNAQPGDQQAGEPAASNPITDNDASAPANTGKEARQNNWNNGRRRIEQRQSAKARIRELEAEIAKLKGKDDDYSRFRTEQLQDRVGDMRAMAADAEATEFANRAAQWFGDETDQFMQDTYRYAQYVNNNEPDLLRYAQRDYGPILLHEWYKRMDNPVLREQWLGMTVYEKGSVLNNLYTQIANIVAQAQNGGANNTPPAQPKPATVPVPNGGRQSAAAVPTDDFGVALQDAFNRVR